MEDPIYKVETDKGITILTLTLDNITMHKNEDLKKAFTKLLDEGKKRIVLDLSNTNFISTIVIASFVFMLKRAKESGGNLIICGAKEKVKEVLTITNLDKIFDICEDKQKAMSLSTKK